jgi:hypothetical protein
MLVAIPNYEIKRIIGSGSFGKAKTPEKKKLLQARNNKPIPL